MVVQGVTVCKVFVIEVVAYSYPIMTLGSHVCLKLKPKVEPLYFKEEIYKDVKICIRFCNLHFKFLQLVL